MDRQPLTTLVALLAGCAQQPSRERAFDAPGPIAVLAADEGPFENAVPFVASVRSGLVLPLDLKRGVLLADQVGAPFVRPRGVAFGDERTIDAIGVWPTDAGGVAILATDLAGGLLLQAPYLDGVRDGTPVVVAPTATDPVFVDADGSGDTPTLVDLEVRAGWTTTESWTLEYDGDRWWAFGSASGKQSTQPTPGTRWWSDRHEVEFTIEGTATAGDRFEWSTDTGVVEHDLGGLPLGLARIGDTAVFAVGLLGVTEGSVVFWDAEAASIVATVPTGAGSHPWRFAYDAEGQRLYAGDAHNPAVHVLAVDAADPGSATLVETLPTAAPVEDLAHTRAGGLDRLFVGLAGASRVDPYDVPTATWIDVSPFDDHVGGIDLYSPVVGVAATTSVIDLAEQSAFGGTRMAPAAVVTLFDGSIVVMDAETGCLATTPTGPRVALAAQTDFVDVDPASSPQLVSDDAQALDADAVATPSSCGGVLRTEAWAVVYDQTQSAWTVEGTLSGRQDAVLVEDTRYLTDDGAMSFAILAGPLPTTHGDTFRLSSTEGVLRMNTYTRPTSTDAIPIEAPGRPVVVPLTSGPTGGGWDPQRTDEVVVVPATGSDAVVRIRLDSWTEGSFPDAVWE